MDVLEVKGATEALASAFAQYQQANDERLALIERKGNNDPLIDEKLRRLDGEINRLQETITKVKTAAARPATPSLTRWGTEEPNEHKGAFLRYLAKGADHDLHQFEQKNFIGSDADGGFLVPADMGDRILARMVETTPMRSLATVMSTTSDALELIRDAVDGEAVWTTETGTPVDTDGISFGKIRIPANELHAQPKASQRLLDDATLNVEEFIINKVAGRFANRENNAFIAGTGQNMPRGFSTYATAALSDANRSWGTFEHVGTGVAGGFAASNPVDTLISLIYKLKAGFTAEAVWMMPRALADEVRRFKDSTGQYLWQPSLVAGQPAQLLGYPVYLAEDMPAKGANSLSIAFGNFREGYTIVDRIGMRIFRDPYTAAPYVKFRCTKRVGGDVTNFEAIKFVKFA